MLKRMQSLELSMTHINHWWPFHTAYECKMMMILPLHHYLTYNCDTKTGHVSPKPLFSFLHLSLRFFLTYVFHIIITSSRPPIQTPTTYTCTQTFILSCSHPLHTPPLALDRFVPGRKQVAERKRLHSLYRLNL